MSPVTPAPVNPAPRRGWCPGLARPMPTGDGLLVRLHPVAGRLTADQARAAARAAREGGNGLLDVTARGNLQIRGVTAESHARVVAILAAAGLGDVRHDGGPQRLTLSAPLAGAGCLAVVAAVEAIGREVTGLPAKTLVAVEDEGGGLGPVEADVWVRVIPDHLTRIKPAGSPLPSGRGVGAIEDRARVTRFSVNRRASCWEQDGRARLRTVHPHPYPSPTRERGSRACSWNRYCPKKRSRSARVRAAPAPARPRHPVRPALARPYPAPTALATLLALLAALAASGARRMRAIPIRSATPSWPISPSASAPGERRVPAGLHGRTLLAELPFGRCDAALLDSLAAWSEARGDGHLALTPSRGFAVTARDDEEAAALHDQAAKTGLIVDPADPRRAVAACPGAPACASGGTPAQGDAPRLAAAFAPWAGRGATAHVSGCPKGCASPSPAALTLVGRPDGRYGVVLDGNAGTPTDLVLTFGAVLERLESTRITAPLDDPSGLRDAFREPA